MLGQGWLGPPAGPEMRDLQRVESLRTTLHSPVGEQKAVSAATLLLVSILFQDFCCWAAREMRLSSSWYLRWRIFHSLASSTVNHATKKEYLLCGPEDFMYKLWGRKHVKQTSTRILL